MHTELFPDLALPLVVTPEPGESIEQVIAEQRPTLADALATTGAVLLRGFDVDGPDDLNRTAQALSGRLLDYTERSSERSSLGGNVFTSTEYPSEEEIFLHNECSYQLTWPRTVYFHCVSEPTTDGATPIADVRDVLRRIDPAVVDEFRARGWSYVRNFGEMGGGWPYYYDTEDPAEVDRYCQEHGIETEWLGPDALRTRAVRKAVHQHPVTGEELWFNHATFFNVRSLPLAYQQQLLDSYVEEDLPSHTFYGDGRRIPEDVVQHLIDAYRGARIRFDWRRGDVLVVDNMLTAHGREPFTGPRKIAIAMGEATTSVGVPA